MAGKKPSKSTPADGRLKENKTAPEPKFGSPAWEAKYGNKKGK